MSQRRSAEARRVPATLLRIGWSIKRQSGSHRVLFRPGWPDSVFAFHDQEEIGRMLARIAKRTGRRPDGLGERACLRFLWEAFNLLNCSNVTAVRTTQFSRSTSAGVCRIAGTPCLVP
jgi:predicted RNA binding protein YcfA (HicA-like mRNA interferase family)